VKRVLRYVKGSVDKGLVGERAEEERGGEGGAEAREEEERARGGGAMALSRAPDGAGDGAPGVQGYSQSSSEVDKPSGQRRREPLVT